MMENNFSQVSDDPQNQNSVPILPSKILPGWELQEDRGNLKKIFTILRRRSLVIGGVTIAIMAGCVYMTLKKIPVYEGNFRLLVEPVSDDNQLPNLTAQQDGNGNNNNSVLDYDSQIQVLTSPELINEAVKDLKISFSDINYDSLNNSLTIQRVGDTKIIDVSYRSRDPERIKHILEKLANTYLDYSLEKRQTKLRYGIQFVEKQLPPIQNKVNQLEQQLQLFRQKYNFIDPQNQSEQLKLQLNVLNEQRIAINQELAKSRSLLKNVQRQEGNLVTLIDKGNSSVYEDVLKKLRDTEIEIAKESARFQENSLPIQVLKEKRENMLSVLRQEKQRTEDLRRKETQRIADVRRNEVVQQLKSLEEQSQVLTQAEQQLGLQLKQLPFLSRQHSELQRNLRIANESLNRFLGARESLQIEIAQTEVPWELVKGPVVPEVPVSPNRKNDLILGLIASTLIGLGSALLLEKLDSSYHSIDELREKVRLPILASIPYEKHLPKHAKYNVSAKFLEALRVLHTNIQLLSSKRGIRSIVISSATFGEGKSTVALHLARTAAAMGKRVLLVDADMRTPQIHQLSGINNSWGLSNVISEGIPTEKVIPRLILVDELSILTAGSTPSDPAKLLASKQMEQLMGDFRQFFDLIIYDAPPVAGLADASLLGYCCDGVMLVTRMNKNDRSSLEQAIDNLRMSHISVLGIVANGTKKS